MVVVSVGCGVIAHEASEQSYELEQPEQQEQQKQPQGKKGVANDGHDDHLVCPEYGDLCEDDLMPFCDLPYLIITDEDERYLVP
jgi:hypothetical protein